MLANIEAFHQPATLEEAARLLTDPDQEAIVVAGATAVSLGVRGSVRALVDISRLGLDRVWLDDEGLHLGAMVRCTQIYRDAQVRGSVGDALPESAFAVAGETIRNLCSLGGNVVHLTSWSDMPPACQVLDARFKTGGARSETYPVERFFAQLPKRLLAKGEIVTEIVIPPPPPHSGSAFLKFAKTAVDYALVNAAALVAMDGDRVAEVRASVGAIHTPPIRMSDAEAELTGHELTADRLAAAAKAASAQVSPRKDARATEDYLRHCAGVLVKRAVAKAAARARGEDV